MMWNSSFSNVEPDLKDQNSDFAFLFTFFTNLLITGDIGEQVANQKYIM